jgi:RimJ/RimL family protein N-acetyltransferase
MCILKTKRLRLRELTLDDLDDLHAVLSDPVSMAHYPKPFDRDMTQGWIEWNLRNYRDHGFGLWAAILKEDGLLVGDCGLTVQRVEGVDELEIGYHILRSHQGRGLATEGARAVRDYAFDILDRDRVISWMGPENTPSRRVAEKVGMVLEREAVNNRGKSAVVYSMTPDMRLGDSVQCGMFSV